LGHTIVNLADKKFPEHAIFNNRLVVEIAETVHFHYRNLRIALSEKDWREFGKGMADAWKRWNERGCPPTGSGHIELCRKDIATVPIDRDYCKVNLNRNLYAVNEGRIFAEGAELDDEQYVHLKIRDIRLELTKAEFKILAEAIRDASDVI
jgi:hypothetical protein